MFADNKKGIKAPVNPEDKTISELNIPALLGASGLQFTLTALNLPPMTFSVASFELHEALSFPFILNVELASKNPMIDFASVLDEDATLTVWRDGVPERSVSGMVASFEQGDTGFHRTRYSMVIRPALWRTTLRRNSRIFQQQSVQEILDVLMKENGNIDYAYAFRYPHAVREFCVQYQETDFEFIQRLTAEEGIFYYFEFEGNSHKLIFTDDVSAQSDGVVLPYNPHKKAQAKEVCINTFRRTEHVRTAKVKLKDYTFKNPVWPAEFSKQAKDLEHQRPTYEHYDFPGRFKDEQQGADFTRYRLESLRNDAQQGEGESNCFKLHPGELFTLTRHPRIDLNKRWQIITVTHIGSQPQALEEEAGTKGGTTLTERFTFISDKQTWRPLSLPKPQIDGPQIAIVVGPEGEEIYTDKYGRVRLRFLWDRYAKGDDTSSCWIRVSQAWAGKGWGFMAIPRIGQEVIVDFLNGDPDQPIVIGRTYHANNLPSLGLPGAKTQTAFRSNTHKGKGYNELRFEDENGRQEVVIHAQRDMNTTVLHNSTSNISVNHTFNVGNNENIEIKNNQKIKVGVNQNISIGSNQTIHVGNNMSLNAGDKIELICGNSSITLLSNGHITIKGKFIETIGEDKCSINTKAMSVEATDTYSLESKNITSNGSVEHVIKGGMVKLNP